MSYHKKSNAIKNNKTEINNIRAVKTKTINILKLKRKYFP